MAFNEPDFDFDSWKASLSKADIVVINVALGMALKYRREEFSVLYVGSAVIFGIPKDECVEAGKRLLRETAKFAAMAHIKCSEYAKEKP